MAYHLPPLEGLTGAQTSLNGNHWRLGVPGDYRID